MNTKSVTGFTIPSYTAYSKYACVIDNFVQVVKVHHLVIWDLNPKASHKYSTKNRFVNSSFAALINSLQCNSYIKRRYGYTQLPIFENSRAVALARARLKDKRLNI